MRTWAARIVVAMALVVTALAAGTPTSASTAVCIPVRATGSGQDLGNFETVATIFVAGVPVGSTAATFTPAGQDGSTVFFTGPIVFSARFGLGSFTVSASGSVDVSTGVFEAVGPVTAGTRVLRGVSGELTFNGIQDLITGAFTETVRGRLCFAHRSAAALLFEPGSRSLAWE